MCFFLKTPVGWVEHKNGGRWGRSPVKKLWESMLGTCWGMLGPKYGVVETIMEGMVSE